MDREHLFQSIPMPKGTANILPFLKSENENIHLKYLKFSKELLTYYNYIDKIITDWHDRNLKTPSDVQNYITQSKTQTQNIKKLEKETGYTNYEQRERSDWDSFYAN